MPRKNDARAYPKVIAWSEEDACFVASVPALRGCMSHGETEEEAARNIAEAAEAWLRGAAEAGFEIPPPPAGKSGQMPLRMPVWLHDAITHRAEFDQVSVTQWIVSVLSFHVGAAAPPSNRVQPIVTVRRERSVDERTAAIVNGALRKPPSKPKTDRPRHRG